MPPLNLIWSHGAKKRAHTQRQFHWTVRDWKQVGVSKNRGTPKWMVYNGKPYLFKWMIWGKTHYFRKHPSQFDWSMKPRICSPRLASQDVCCLKEYFFQPSNNQSTKLDPHSKLTASSPLKIGRNPTFGKACISKHLFLGAQMLVSGRVTLSNISKSSSRTS